MTDGELAYLTAEAKARIEIDRMLADAGWAVQDARAANLSAAQGVAVREFGAAPLGRAARRDPQACLLGRARPAGPGRRARR